MENKLRLAKIVLPQSEEDYYFVTFTSGEHKTEKILERHSIEIEVMVEGSTSLGDVKKITEERAIGFLKTLARIL